MQYVRLMFVIVLAAVCGAQPGAWAAAEKSPLPGTVLVFCAASTTDAIEEIRHEYQRLHPSVAVRPSYAASSRLAQQIEAGAKADLFLSASEAWGQFVAQRNEVARQQDLLGNQLVIVVPSDSSLAIERPSDLASDKVRRLALADVSSVPAGIYAKQSLEKLGLWKSLARKATGAADVRQALRFVETGAAQAGIVYATDAAASTQVRIVARIDPQLAQPTIYPLLLLKHGAENPAAVAFYRFLSSPAAAAVFRRHGFLVVDSPRPNAPAE